MAIREWHVVISGFQQKSGTLNGIAQIWLQLVALMACRPEARVELLTWKDDFGNLAETISRIASTTSTNPDGIKPVINIYGYSWGGMSAVNFARELQDRGLDVNHMVLSDAVYRHWYWLGQWRAFAPWRSIMIPENVRQVTQFRQKRNWPRGHTIKADNPGKTKLGMVRWLNAKHCWMDDQAAFRQACWQAAQAVKNVEVQRCATS